MTTHKKRQPAQSEQPAPADTTNAPKSGQRFDAILNGLIMVGILLVVGLAVSMIAPDLKKRFTGGNSTSKPGGQTAMQSTTVAGITVKSQLAAATAESAVSFIQLALKVEDQPQELTFQSIEQADETRGPAAVANWNKNGKFISVLAGETNDKKPAYFRIWTMPTGEKVTETQAKTLLANLLSPEYLNNFPTKISCQNAKNPTDGTDITECAAMKTLDNGNLVGVTVRAPITLQPPPGAPIPTGVENPKVIIVSACSVPREGTSFYPAPNCQ